MSVFFDIIVNVVLVIIVIRVCCTCTKSSALACEGSLVMCGLSAGRQRQVLATLSETVRARAARSVLQQARVRAEHRRGDRHLSAAVLPNVRSSVERRRRWRTGCR